MIYMVNDNDRDNLLNISSPKQRILKCVEEKTDLKEAEILASANLALLTEMAGSKTHGFSTWALNPTIFDLVTSVSVKSRDIAVKSFYSI